MEIKIYGKNTQNFEFLKITEDCIKNEDVSFMLKMFLGRNGPLYHVLTQEEVQLLAQFGRQVAEYSRKPAKPKETKKKLYEFVGFRKYGIVIAANDLKTATLAAKRLKDDWLNWADEIGCDTLDTEDVFDVRPVPDGADLVDVAHIIV